MPELTLDLMKAMIEKKLSEIKVVLLGESR